MRLLWLLLLFTTSIYAKDIDISIPELPLIDAIRLLANEANINVVINSEVNGVAALQVTHANPKEVLQSLLVTHDLVKSVNGGVWYIAPRSLVAKQLQSDIDLEVLQESAATLLHQSWRLRYARASDVMAMIKNNESVSSERGQVWIDVRTNLIAARDTKERLKFINELIRKVDVPIQQVLIEARLVSVDQDAERQLGVEYAVKETSRQQPALSGGAFKFAAQGHYSVAVAHLPDGSLLDIRLLALERAGKARLISSPSLFTANNQEATIEAGEEVPYQEVSESGGTAVAFKKAVLGLKVTPQVLPNQQLLLALKINQDRPSVRQVQGVPSINTRQIVTNVQVKSGKTIVLGGIFEKDEEEGQEMLPILGNIPIIGLLFTQKGKRQHKRELLIFVTPKIIPVV